MSPEPKPAGEFGVKADDRICGVANREGMKQARANQRGKIGDYVVVRNPQDTRRMSANPCRLDGNDADRVGVRREKNPEPERRRWRVG